MRTFTWLRFLLVSRKGCLCLERFATFSVPAAALLFTLACNTRAFTLSWHDTSENEDGFRIYRVANNQKVFIAQVGPNVTQYVDKNAPPGACYIVTAFNAAGESAATKSACGTP